MKSLWYLYIDTNVCWNGRRSLIFSFALCWIFLLGDKIRQTNWNDMVFLYVPSMVSSRKKSFNHASTITWQRLRFHYLLENFKTIETQTSGIANDLQWKNAWNFFAWLSHFLSHSIPINLMFNLSLIFKFQSHHHPASSIHIIIMGMKSSIIVILLMPLVFAICYLFTTAAALIHSLTQSVTDCLYQIIFMKNNIKAKRCYSPSHIADSEKKIDNRFLNQFIYTDITTATAAPAKKQQQQYQKPTTPTSTIHSFVCSLARICIEPFVLFILCASTIRP